MDRVMEGVMDRAWDRVMRGLKRRAEATNFQGNVLKWTGRVAGDVGVAAAGGKAAGVGMADAVSNSRSESGNTMGRAAAAAVGRQAVVAERRLTCARPATPWPEHQHRRLHSWPTLPTNPPHPRRSRASTLTQTRRSVRLAARPCSLASQLFISIAAWVHRVHSGPGAFWCHPLLTAAFSGPT